MEDLDSQIKANANKLFWVVVIVILCAWFINEYRTTNRLVQEQASLAFSNLSEQVGALIYKDQSQPDAAQSSSLENLNRFKSELNRLVSEFNGSIYSRLGSVLKAKLGISTNDSQTIHDLEAFLENSKIDTYNGQSIEFVVKEIAELMKARALLLSKDDAQKKAGAELLVTLIKTAEIIPVEAYVTYVLSLPKDEVKTALSGDLLSSCMKRKPELKDTLDAELAAYGIVAQN